MDQGSIAVWDNLGKGMKAEFIWLAQDLRWRSRAQRAMLQIFVDVTQSISFSGTGEFFALSDLAEMYKRKPALF